jgi:copper chaperone
MEEVELKVDGMTCGSCVKSASRALSAVPGVESVDVRLADGAATVRGDGVAAQVPAMLAALAAAGYEGRPAEAASASLPQPQARGGGGSGRADGGGCCCGR